MFKTDAPCMYVLQSSTAKIGGAEVQIKAEAWGQVRVTVSTPMMAATLVLTPDAARAVADELVACAETIDAAQAKKEAA